MASEALADQLFEANDSAHKGYLDKDDLTVALVELLGYEPRKSDIERYQNARGEYRVTRAMFGDIVGSYRPLLSKPNRREAFQCLDDKGQGFLKLHDLIAKGQQVRFDNRFSKTASANVLHGENVKLHLQIWWTSKKRIDILHCSSLLPT
eukprot:TRINITY_DN9594_c0_g2_i2.p1 TRINITY_DN9594_c0_g2~~TRINITY_DN9594_c0_g2_i2.p1  ORF type:complete len:150 (+),score=16.18 TRINITY_DN9594_c0_g2_i2:93-542(+)